MPRKKNTHHFIDYKKLFRNIAKPQPIPNLPSEIQEKVERTRFKFYYITSQKIAITLMMMNEFPYIGPHLRQKILKKDFVPFLRRLVAVGTCYGYPKLSKRAQILMDRILKINQIPQEAIYYFRRDILCLYSVFYPVPQKMYTYLSFTARRDFKARSKIETNFNEELNPILAKMKEERALLRKQKKEGLIKNERGRPKKNKA